MDADDLYNLARSESQNRPSLTEKIKTFTKSSLKFMASGMHRTPDDKQEERRTICESCEFYDKDDKNPSCTKCGCFLNIKISWASEECPIGKWTSMFHVPRGKGCGGCGRR